MKSLTNYHLAYELLSDGKGGLYVDLEPMEINQIFGELSRRACIEFLTSEDAITWCVENGGLVADEKESIKTMMRIKNIESRAMRRIRNKEYTDKLVKGWIHAQSFDVESSEYDEVCWAIDELYHLAHDKPDQLLKIVLDILNIDSSKKIIRALGAGVLEELLVSHGDEYIQDLLKIADSNSNFKECLGFVYIDEGDVSPHVYEKVQSIKMGS